MRIVKKIITDILMCRIKRSTLLIIVFVTFVAGNVYLLLPNFYRGDLKSNTFLVTSDKDVSDEEYTVTRLATKQKPKTKETKDLFQRKFEEYRKQAMEEIAKLPDSKTKNEVDFYEHIVTLHPNTHTQLPKPHEKEPVKERQNIDMAVLVISCNRPSVGRCLDSIIKYKPENVNIPIIVSQDCGHEPTTQVIRSYGDKVTHMKQPELGDVPNVPANMKRFMGYYKISRHFKFALTKVFSDLPVNSVVIVEDDIDIAPDFFDYFLAAKPLLDEDQSLYCVSAWNDNGKPEAIDKTAISLLHRSDFFPGLGWLITRRIWEELSPKWPSGFWDDWMRAPEQRKDRACIRPEISRTKTFGREGVSQGQFYDQYLKYIVLNEKPYPFRDIDLSYLKKTIYDDDFLYTVYSIRESPPDKANEPNTDGSEEPIRITYHNNGEIEMLTKKFGLMSDLKAGVPRTAYKGVVSFYRNSRRIYLAPPSDWKGYSEN